MLKFKPIFLLAAVACSPLVAYAEDPVVTPSYSVQIPLNNLTAPNIIEGFTAVAPPVGGFYAQNLYVSPAATIDLGSVNLGTKLSRVLAIQNISGKSMKSAKALFQTSSTSDKPTSSVACTPPLTLTSAAPGEVCDMVVSITPTVAGVVAFSIKASGSTDVNELGESTFNFVATVIDPNATEPTPPGITLSPSLVDFAATSVGGTSLAYVQVQNSSPSEALVDLRALISGTYFSISSSDCGSSGSPVQLAGGATCQVSLAFNPLAEGNFVGTLSLDAANSDNGTQSALLSGSVTPSPVAGTLEFSTTAVNFGNVAIDYTGSNTESRFITVTNTDSVARPFQVSTYPTNPGLSLDWSCSDPVEPGDSCTISLMFSSTSLGPFSDSFSVESGSDTFTVAVSGSVYQPLLESNSTLEWPYLGGVYVPGDPGFSTIFDGLAYYGVELHAYNYSPNAQTIVGVTVTDESHPGAITFDSNASPTYKCNGAFPAENSCSYGTARMTPMTISMFNSPAYSQLDGDDGTLSVTAKASITLRDNVTNAITVETLRLMGSYIAPILLNSQGHTSARSVEVYPGEGISSQEISVAAISPAYAAVSPITFQVTGFDAAKWSVSHNCSAGETSCSVFVTALPGAALTEYNSPAKLRVYKDGRAISNAVYLFVR